MSVMLPMERMYSRDGFLRLRWAPISDLWRAVELSSLCTGLMASKSVTPSEGRRWTHLEVSTEYVDRSSLSTNHELASQTSSSKLMPTF